MSGVTLNCGCTASSSMFGDRHIISVIPCIWHVEASKAIRKKLQELWDLINDIKIEARPFSFDPKTTITHVNPNCKDATKCFPHPESGPVEYNDDLILIKKGGKLK